MVNHPHLNLNNLQALGIILHKIQPTTKIGVKTRPTMPEPHLMDQLAVRHLSLKILQLKIVHSVQVAREMLQGAPKEIIFGEVMDLMDLSIAVIFITLWKSL